MQINKLIFGDVNKFLRLFFCLNKSFLFVLYVVYQYVIKTKITF